MDPKKQLADLMDAFAAAKSSQNEMLQRLVLGQINAFFQTHEITPIQQGQVPTPQPQAPDFEDNSMTSWS